MSIGYGKVTTPCYICDNDRLRENLAILNQIPQKSGCQLLLALKAFAMVNVFPLLKQTLAGTAASSVNEARLGYEEFGGFVHMYAPAYIESQLSQLLGYSDYIIFNSFSQWRRFKDQVVNLPKPVKCGLRINPEYSVVKTEKYDPCARFSRLGIVQNQLQENELDGITGFHFHTHCESSAVDFERSLQIICDKFEQILYQLEWVNLGGGHHITKEGYDVTKLCSLLSKFKNTFNVDVFLEPGEAIALNAGVLVTTVLDIIHNEIDIAILDSSAVAHMPDVLEMPYQPRIIGASKSSVYPHHYQLAGLTCLAGDVIGNYYFEEPLRIGSRVVFLDMLHYTMVKNTTFNGVGLPSIATWSGDQGLSIVKEFGYEDYKSRLS